MSFIEVSFRSICGRKDKVFSEHPLIIDPNGYSNWTVGVTLELLKTGPGGGGVLPMMASVLCSAV